MTTTSDTPSQAERAGWKLVPVTATDEMLDTLLKRFDSSQSWWQALLAASPAPPAEALPASGVEAVRKAALLEAAQIAWQFSAKAVPPDGPRTMARLIAAKITRRAALTSAPAPEDRT